MSRPLLCSACRTGVDPGMPSTTAALAESLKGGLYLRGLQVYVGTAQHLRSKEERAQAVQVATATAKLHLEALRASGIATDGLIVSGGGTGTLPLESETGLYNEVQ